MKLTRDDAMLIAGLTHRERILLWVMACNADNRGLVTVPRQALAAKFYEAVRYMDNAIEGMYQKGVLRKTARGHQLVLSRLQPVAPATMPLRPSVAVGDAYGRPQQPLVDVSTQDAGGAPPPQT